MALEAAMLCARVRIIQLLNISPILTIIVTDITSLKDIPRSFHFLMWDIPPPLTHAVFSETLKILGAVKFQKDRKSIFIRLFQMWLPSDPVGLTTTRLFSFVCIGIQKALVQW